MIEIIDTIALGTAIKEMRIIRNYSQKQLAEKVGITVKTYRDIELGKREPLLRTLFSIQKILNTDLISYLKESNYISQYASILKTIDELIFVGDMDKIKRVIKNFSNIRDQYILVEPKELIQFKLLLKAFIKRSQGTNASINEAIAICAEAIDTIKKDVKFSYFELEHFTYSLLEFRLLFFLGSCYNRLKDYEKSIVISKFIIESLQNSILDSHDSHKLIIKSYVNLSYDYNMMCKDCESIKYADLGIECCKAIETTFLLYNLLFRKGASYFYLKDTFMMHQCIDQSLTLLNILGKEDIHKMYLTIATEKFNYKKKM